VVEEDQDVDDGDDSLVARTLCVSLRDILIIDRQGMDIMLMKEREHMLERIIERGFDEKSFPVK
jgi:hypothetical protein